MSTDLQQTNGASNRPKFSELKVRHGQGVVVETVQDVHNFAVFAAAQGLVPSSFRQKNGEWNTGAITIALIKGLELGMKATQSLQSIYVVNNQPAVWGDALPGLVLATGLMTDFREWYEGDPFDDDFTAICVTKRKGLESERVERYSVADAKTAGLWGKTGRNGQPTPWVTHPKRMLLMRPRSYNFRANFADVLKGLQIVEEVQDIEVETHSDEPEFESRQDEMLAGLTDDVIDVESDLPPEPDEDEAEAIRRAEAAEAGLFNEESRE